MKSKGGEEVKKNFVVMYVSRLDIKAAIDDMIDDVGSISEEQGADLEGVDWRNIPDKDMVSLTNELCDGFLGGIPYDEVMKRWVRSEYLNDDSYEFQ